ncbi:MAG: LCP family protein [Lachnospiraceae bacterium]|nr:LCP family protein [Lachnospiraceae bacterium]
MTENNKEKLSEMEQIHRGLEEFLEKEVYEEYETLQGDGTGTGEAYGDWEDAGASEKGTTQRQAEKGAGASQKGQDMSKAEKRKQTSSAPKTGGEQAGKSRKKKKHKGLKRFLAAVLVLVLALGLLWYFAIDHLYDKVEYTPTDILADEPMKEEGVTNILLIGNDSRVNGEDGRSDAMILVSISNKTKTIYMTSLLRDIYVEIPDHESNRLNAAYAFGGPELLLETIKLNFDIEVNRYVQVNFQAFANLIDAVGGVDLELTNEEVQWVNAYLNEYNLLENRPMDTDYLSADASGLLHLNGPQALAYCRNRYIGSDFGRTERQRKVLEAVIRQLPSSVLTNLNELIEGILPNLTTNISKAECYTLSLEVPKVLTYDIVQASIPLEGTYQNVTIRKMSVLQVDFEKNKEYIRTQIYGEEAVRED